VTTKGLTLMCDHANREAAMVIVERDDAGRPLVWCDPCLVPLVAALNAGGLLTRWSCCGHGRLPSVVGLGDDRQVLVLDSPAELERVLGTAFPDDHLSPEGVEL